MLREIDTRQLEGLALVDESLNGSKPDIGENPLYEILEHSIVFNEAMQPRNFVENERSFVYLSLKIGPVVNGALRSGRYFVYDPKKLTGIVVASGGFSESQLDHQRELYEKSHELAETGDPSILVFYKQEE